MNFPELSPLYRFGNVIINKTIIIQGKCDATNERILKLEEQICFLSNNASFLKVCCSRSLFCRLKQGVAQIVSVLFHIFLFTARI
jgi:hypothetical protein